MIVRYLNGELSDEESARLMAAIGENEEYRKLFAVTKNIWALNKALYAPEARDSAVAFRVFEQRIALRQERGRIRMLRYVRNAAAVLFLPVLLALFLLPREREQAVYAGEMRQTLSTPMGVKSRVVLPDGTEVRLNSGTTLVCPTVFAGEKRVVELDGEAYFDVKRDTLFPFEVRLNGGAKIEVLGTSFNVSCYSNDPRIETTLVSGEVVFQKGDSRLKMKPEETVYFAKGESEARVKREATELHTAWTEDRLLFRNTPMDEVVRKLERWYGVKIHVADERINKYHITATFEGENLTQVMDLLQISSPMKYKINVNDVFLSVE